MLKMRLQRVGRKHETAFRLVLTEMENSTKSGRFKEILGSYDPRKSTDAFNTERIKYWLSQGVKPTGTVQNLLITHKILDAKKVNVLPRKKPIVKEAKVEAEVAKPAAEVTEASAEVPAEAAPEPVVESNEAPAAAAE